MLQQEEKRHEGGLNNTEHRFPTRLTWPNLVLTRGVSRISQSGWDWLYGFGDGKVKRMDGIVVLLDDRHIPHNVWKFRRGFPVRFEGPKLKGDRQRGRRRGARDRARGALAALDPASSAPRRGGEHPDGRADRGADHPVESSTTAVAAHARRARPDRAQRSSRQLEARQRPQRAPRRRARPALGRRAATEPGGGEP